MSPEQIAGWTKFLEYGPIGLAALMLVLVIVALSIGDFTAARERIMKLFLYVGAACFAVAVLAGIIQRPQQFQVFFRVIPLESEDNSLPKPLITVNNKQITDGQASIDRELTIIIDVSKAISVAKTIRETLVEQEKVLRDTNGNIDLALNSINRLGSYDSPITDAARYNILNATQILQETRNAVSRTIVESGN